MVEGSRMWAIFLLTIMLLTLLSAAPIDITDDIKKEDAKADNDSMHSHDENVARGGKLFGHNQFDLGNNVPGSVEGDHVSIGHEVNIDVQGHTHDHHHYEDDTVIECKGGLREMFKSIDSNKDGLMDAMELLGVCHQNNIQITKPLAVRILTLPDKMVGFNIAKFCELLKDCQSTNSADLIYFLLQLFDKGADVLELDAQNFHGVVSSYSYILVLFYAPWCPICKRLFPEYDAAAKILAEKPIGSYTRMAKIDATVHTALRDHYKIPGYPTMKLFYNGQEFAILTGFQKANSIVDWLDSQRGTRGLTTTTTMAITGGSTTTTTMAITGGPTTTTTMAITATTTNTNEQNTCVCGQVASDLVVGGENAVIDEFPWLAILKGPQPLENFEWCGGSLINDRWIVTASHCFKHGAYDAKSPDKLKVILGEHNLYATDDTTWTFDVEKIILHPGYDFAVTTPRSNDIALLKLKSRVDINRFVPVCLPNPYADYTEETATVIGWGNSLSSSRILQKMEGLQVVNDYVCSEAMKKKMADTLENRITSDMLCAGGEEGKDSCPGNSGLPLLYKNQQNELIGVSSWGVDCGVKDAYGVYAETSVFVNWIKNTVEANGGGEYCEH